jgi:hypothetical protein
MRLPSVFLLASLSLLLLAQGASAQMSPLDIVNNARLQGLMRLCQQQTRDELRIPPDQESTSSEFRASYLDCMRDQRAGYRVSQ